MDISTLTDALRTALTQHPVLLTVVSLCIGTVAIAIAAASLVRLRRARASDEKELRELKIRLARLEACEQRRFMQTLNRPSVNTERMQEETAETYFPIAPSDVMLPVQATRTRQA